MTSFLIKCLFFIISVSLVNTVPLENLFNKCKFLDLSYEFNENTIYWPTQDSFKGQKVHKGQTTGGYYYEAYKFCAAEHGGTHLDAPSHFAKDAPTVEKLRLENFVAEAFVINITEKTKKDSNYTLTVDDIKDFESKYGQIEDQAILIVYTGWGVHWPNKAEYLGSAVPGDDKHLQFPGVSKAAAEWLVSNRSIAVLGIDTASIDPGNSRNFSAHRILLANNISAFENLRNVDNLPPRGATIVALPMSITNGSGAPLRAFAVGWDGDNDPCKLQNGAATSFTFYQLIISFVTLIFTMRLQFM